MSVAEETIPITWRNLTEENIQMPELKQTFVGKKFSSWVTYRFYLQRVPNRYAYLLSTSARVRW